MSVELALRIRFDWFQSVVPSWTRRIDFPKESPAIQSKIIKIVKDQFVFRLRKIHVKPSLDEPNLLIVTGVDTKDWGGHDNFVNGIADFCKEDFSGLVNDRYAVDVEMAPGFTVKVDLRFKLISCKPFVRGEEPSRILRNFGMFHWKHVVFSGFEDPALKIEFQIYNAFIDEQISNRTHALIVQDITEVTDDTKHAALNGIVVFGRKELDFMVLTDAN